jgi:hypothetical protein
MTASLHNELKNNMKTKSLIPTAGRIITGTSTYPPEPLDTPWMYFHMIHLNIFLQALHWACKKITCQSSIWIPGFFHHSMLRRFLCHFMSSREQSSSWEADSCSASQEILCLVWYPNVRYTVRKRHIWARRIQFISSHLTFSHPFQYYTSIYVYVSQVIFYLLVYNLIAVIMKIRHVLCCEISFHHLSVRLTLTENVKEIVFFIQIVAYRY